MYDYQNLTDIIVKGFGFGLGLGIVFYMASWGLTTGLRLFKQIF
jgi:hypothetical protein